MTKLICECGYVPKQPIMDESDVIANLRCELDEAHIELGKRDVLMREFIDAHKRHEDELANLRAERDALAERIRQTPTVREIVGELRQILRRMETNSSREAMKRQLADLLRRLDVEET